MKTALVLSGGGSKGGYETGVWKALSELNIEINMIFGTSVGSINGAMFAIGEYNRAADMWGDIRTDEIFDIKTPQGPFAESRLFGVPMNQAYGYTHEILTNLGAENNGLRAILNDYIDEDKLRASNIEYGLVTTELGDSPFSLDQYSAEKDMYISDIPYGQLSEYILASASCFPAARYNVINGKRYVDGGYTNNLPINMALKRGADRIIAVNLKAVGQVNEDYIKEAKEKTDFTMISPSFPLGNFLIFDPIIAKNNIIHGYLDTLRKFGKYDGYDYTFIKNEMNSFNIKRCEACGRIFNMPGDVIYSKVTFNSFLKLRILDAQIAYRRNAINSKLESHREKLRNTKTVMENLRSKIGADVFVIFIAKDILEYGSESFFLRSVARRFLKDEIFAATYILSNKLLEK